MNQKREKCFCGSELIRMSGQDHGGKIHLGFYCKKCDKIFNKELMPMITYRAVQWQKVIERTGITVPQESLPKELQDLKKDPEKSFEIQVRHNEIKEASGNQEFIK